MTEEGLQTANAASARAETLGRDYSPEQSMHRTEKNQGPPERKLHPLTWPEGQVDRSNVR